MFNGDYEGSRVLVTGHTGFKGSWLSLWLRELGAEVVGLSNAVPEPRSHFHDAGLRDSIKQYWVDVRDREKLAEALDEVKPDFVFHLAAQPLVTESYLNPIETFETNIMGTANLLEALRSSSPECVAVMVTSDKCYENTDTFYGYRETDALGGADPYSASKGAAEIVISGYRRSFFDDASAARIGVVRSGNVIGGGDWSADRLVPDIIRAWEAGEVVSIRRPAATRPWQHVLEPLAGYLHLAVRLRSDSTLHGEAFNFGPQPSAVKPVMAVLDEFRSHLPGLRSEVQEEGWNYEAGQLGLNCDKAITMLDWGAILDFHDAVRATAEWYARYNEGGPSAAAELTIDQIRSYSARARDRGITWAEPGRSAA